MSVVIGFYYYSKTKASVTDGIGGSSTSKTHTNLPGTDETAAASLLQEKKLRGNIPGVFFRGVGHLYVGLVDPRGVDLRFDPSNVRSSILPTCVLFVALFNIFKGTLPMSTRKQLGMTALAGTVSYTLFDIPPTFLFAYITGMIYITSSIYMLSLPK